MFNVTFDELDQAEQELDLQEHRNAVEESEQKVETILDEIKSLLNYGRGIAAVCLRRACCIYIWGQNAKSN